MIELVIKSFNERAIVDDIMWKFHAKVFNLARGGRNFRCIIIDDYPMLLIIR